MDADDVVQLTVRRSVASIELFQKAIGFFVRYVGNVGHEVLLSGDRCVHDAVKMSAMTAPGQCVRGSDRTWYLAAGRSHSCASRCAAEHLVG